MDLHPTGKTLVVTLGKINAVSDGGFNRAADAPDTLGGFFGNTKFIYGTGADDYFAGTNYEGQKITKTFRFVSYN
jgi:hypothetical protein